MTISSSEIKRNMTILLDDDVYQVIDWQHRQAPKAPPTLTLKVRQISSGNVYERKLPGNQKLTVADTETRSSQFLYSDGDLFHFMDDQSFEQFSITKELLKDSTNFFSEGDSIDMLMYKGSPIMIELPPTVKLQITSTEIGLKGDTQSGATKPATTSTGLTLNVPLFINSNDYINISTSTGEYTGRAE